MVLFSKYKLYNIGKFAELQTVKKKKKKIISSVIAIIGELPILWVMKYNEKYNLNKVEKEKD